MKEYKHTHTHTKPFLQNHSIVYAQYLSTKAHLLNIIYIQICIYLRVFNFIYICIIGYAEVMQITKIWLFNKYGVLSFILFDYTYTLGFYSFIYIYICIYIYIYIFYISLYIYIVYILQINIKSKKSMKSVTKCQNVKIQGPNDTLQFTKCLVHYKSEENTPWSFIAAISGSRNVWLKTFPKIIIVF